MSYAYDSYLKEHIGNVQRGVQLMKDHLDYSKLGLSYDDFYAAISNAEKHDQSKYSLDEYEAYDAYFYRKNRSYGVVMAFNYAWLHHQNCNPHHWQYWVLINDDDGQNKALEMPKEYVLEMLADWWTFSWKNGNLKEIFDWYSVHKKTMVLHPKTEKLVENILDALHKAIIEYEKLTGGQENGISDERSSL